MTLTRTLFALFTLCLSTKAQEIGVSTCACQPATYEFTLNFDLTCANRDVQRGDPGIVDSACILNPQGSENVTDLVPLRVTEIQILELDQELKVVAQSTLRGSYLNGDVFSYSSITQTQPTMLNATSVPKGIQVFLTGRNAEEQDLVNFWAIVYDNDCGVFPLLNEGQQMGWTIFTNLGDPPQFLCPAVGPSPTEVPIATPSPTLAPDQPETDAPTNAETEAPTQETATEAPTEATAAPTEATAAPTMPEATDEPTEMPVVTPPTSRPPTARPPVTGCPPTSAPSVPENISGSYAQPTSSKGNRRRHLMVRNTVAPTACPEPNVEVFPESTPRPAASGALPVKKDHHSTKSKTAMQKLTKGYRSSSKGTVASASTYSSNGARRRFLMEGRRSV